MMNNDIANGKHYKRGMIEASDIGRTIDEAFYVEKMRLNEFQLSLLRILTPHEPQSLFNRVIRSFDEGFYFDPFFVAERMIFLAPIDFTIFKKVVRMGRGEKSVEQDKADIIGACEAGLKFKPNAARYGDIIEAVKLSLQQ